MEAYSGRRDSRFASKPSGALPSLSPPWLEVVDTPRAPFKNWESTLTNASGSVQVLIYRTVDSLRRDLRAAHPAKNKPSIPALWKYGTVLSRHEECCMELVSIRVAFLSFSPAFLPVAPCACRPGNLTPDCRASFRPTSGSAQPPRQVPSLLQSEATSSYKGDIGV